MGELIRIILVQHPIMQRKNNIKSIGIIRGEKQLKLNHTLTFAQNQGMKLHYVSREDYRHKHKLYFINKLKKKIWRFLFITRGWVEHFSS